jgi:hypothetical protein
VQGLACRRRTQQGPLSRQAESGTGPCGARTTWGASEQVPGPPVRLAPEGCRLGRPTLEHYPSSAHPRPGVERDGEAGSRIEDRHGSVPFRYEGNALALRSSRTSGNHARSWLGVRYQLPGVGPIPSASRAQPSGSVEAAAHSRLVDCREPDGRQSARPQRSKRRIGLVGHLSAASAEYASRRSGAHRLPRGHTLSREQNANMC